MDQENNKTIDKKVNGEYNKKKNYSILKGFIAGVLLGLILFQGLLMLGIYKYSWDGAIIYKFSKIFPLPVVMVNFRFISYRSFLDDVYALEKYQKYKNGENAKVDKNELKRIVLNQFINRSLIEDRLRSYGVKIDNNKINEALNSIYKDFGSKDDFAKRLKELYNWSIDDFKNKILKYNLEETELSKRIVQDMTIKKNKEAYEKAKKALERLKKGESFEDVAKDMSEDLQSADKGGDIGWLEKGTIDEDIEKVLFKMKKGEISDILKTRFGYIILKVTDKKPAEKDKAEQVKVSHILINAMALPEYIDKVKESSVIWRFIKI